MFFFFSGISEIPVFEETFFPYNLTHKLHSPLYHLDDLLGMVFDI